MTGVDAFKKTIRMKKDIIIKLFTVHLTCDRKRVTASKVNNLSFGELKGQ